MISHKIMSPRIQAPIEGRPFNQYLYDDDQVWTDFYRRDGGYLLRFPDLADFEVSADGTEVVTYPMPDCDEETIAHLFINQLVPLALSRQGQPSFHASVVTVPGGAVAFLGESGAGKSTLAASFALDGSAFLTDDALLIEEQDGICLAHPSHASLRLWDDSVSALINNDIRRAGPISYTPKARLLAGDALVHNDDLQRLLAAYVLTCREPDEVVIEPVAGVERYMGWLKNSFLLDIEDDDLLQQHFDWTHRVSASVPTFTLDYPYEYAALPGVRQYVREHVASL